METDKVTAIGIHVGKSTLSHISGENLTAFLSYPFNFHGRMMFTLGDYLTKYSKMFDRVRYIITDEYNLRHPNGTLTGIIGLVNRSAIDIGVEKIIMNEATTDMADFAFPFQLSTTTFITQKPEYKPQIFGILQIFSLPLWIAIISTLFAMSLVYYATFKGKYPFDKILFNAFAVLLRQSSTLKPSSMIKKLLVFSWIVGAMFLCLAYDSVFLSFLSFPPINNVKDVSQLAKAVKDGHYHCTTSRFSSLTELLLNSNLENLKVIGQDIQKNNVIDGGRYIDFYYNRNKPNLALIISTDDVEILIVERIFVSEDRFLESMTAMPVRKEFCCKKLIEKFVHRFMASGLYFKYQNDEAFLFRLPRLMEHEERQTSKRILTLIDVAPAFIFLIFGHTISFLVLIVEILSNRMKKKKAEYVSHTKNNLNN